MMPIAVIIGQVAFMLPAWGVFIPKQFVNMMRNFSTAQDYTLFLARLQAVERRPEWAAFRMVNRRPEWAAFRTIAL